MGVRNPGTSCCHANVETPIGSLGYRNGTFIAWKHISTCAREELPVREQDGSVVGEDVAIEVISAIVHHDVNIRLTVDFSECSYEKVL